MIRILVIDDDIEITKMLRRHLETDGYDVAVLPDGNAALKLHRTDPVDLIITDIIMPGKDGLEIIMEFRRDFPGLKIIAISGGGRIEATEYLKIAKALGAVETLSKPFDLTEMSRVVRELVKRFPN